MPSRDTINEIDKNSVNLDKPQKLHHEAVCRP